MKKRNWFDKEGLSYASFRPSYPLQLSRFLASVAPSNNMALDVGCGNGQLTVQLANYFHTVVGIDPSADQIANATQHKRIRYECAPAENIPLPNDSVTLIAAAQSAHWFELKVFYREVRRIVVKRGVLALISYGAPGLDTKYDECFNRFYREKMASYWPAEREMVDDGYRNIDFPFAEFPAPIMKIHLKWNLTELLGYISTWSAVRRAREARREDVFQSFADELANVWGDPAFRHSITWPINIRIGTV